MEHSFDVDIAKKFGIEEAILLKNIQFWIDKNKANDKHQYDGRTWTYNSIRAYSELFPYMSSKMIRNALNKLIEAGLIITGNYNSNPQDRTLWYALSEEDICLNGQSHLPEKEIAFDKTGKSYTDSNPYSKPYSKQQSLEKEEKAEELITYLNQLKEAYGIKGKITVTSSRIKEIKNRLKESKVKIEQVINMFRDRCEKWKGSEFEKYIRIETLFRPSKFQAYIDEAESGPEKDWTSQKQTILFENQLTATNKYSGLW